jgi:hypothetical protein
MAYTYSQLDIPDKELLGSIIQPSDITLENLQTQMSPTCLRSVTSVNISEVQQAHIRRLKSLRQAYKVGDVADTTDAGAMFLAWKAAVSEIYLEPFGILPRLPFTWSDDTRQQIFKRNPDLQSQNVTFTLPRSAISRSFRESANDKEIYVDQRPFPIVAWTMIGPSELAPYTPVNRNYSLVESSPVATGVMGSRNNVFYESLSGQSEVQTVGGLVESFAFGGCCPSVDAIPKAYREYELVIPNSCDCVHFTSSGGRVESALGNDSYFDIATAVGLSSYASGCAQASIDDHEELLEATAQLSYWSPITPLQTAAADTGVSAHKAKDAATAKDFMHADGGGLQLLDLVSLIQRYFEMKFNRLVSHSVRRKVKHIYLFYCSSVTLQPTSVWNTSDPSQPLSENYIDFDVPAAFGVIAPDITAGELPSYDLSHAQVSYLHTS